MIVGLGDRQKRVGPCVDGESMIAINAARKPDKFDGRLSEGRRVGRSVGGWIGKIDDFGARVLKDHELRFGLARNGDDHVCRINNICFKVKATVKG